MWLSDDGTTPTLQVTIEAHPEDETMLHTTDLVAASHWRPTLAEALETRLDLEIVHGVTVRRFRHGSYRLNSPEGCRDHLIALRLAGSCGVERTSAGSRDAGRTEAGHLTIQPAGQGSAWEVKGHGELLYLFIPPDLLAQIAEEQDLPASRALPVSRLGVRDTQLRALLQQFLTVFRPALPRPTLLAESLLIQITTEVLRRHTNASGLSPRERAIHPFSSALRRRLEEYLDAHVMEGASVGELASFAGISRSHFIHRFRMTFGTTPHRYLVGLRIELAKRHLADGKSPAEVAYLTGFSDQAHLTTVFRQWTGVTPGSYGRHRYARSG